MLSTSETRYARALHVVLNFEGGFVDNKADPGGATNHGITQHTYDFWRHGKKLVTRPVQAILPEEVSQIYRSMFWEPMLCATMPYPLAVMAFDTAVQWGVHGACDLLREATKTQAVIDSRTMLASFARTHDVLLLANQIYAARKARRLLRVRQRPSSVIFLLGWNRRDSALLNEAQSAQIAAVAASKGPAAGAVPRQTPK